MFAPADGNKRKIFSFHQEGSARLSLSVNGAVHSHFHGFIQRVGQNYSLR